MIEQNLPVIVVLLPLFGGLIASLLPGRDATWAWATCVVAAIFGSAVKLLQAVQAAPNGIVEYELGGWPAEYGIAYRVDHLNASIILVVALIALLTTIYAKPSVEDEIPTDRHNFFWAVWLLAITGLIGITITGDTFNIYVLLEISSLTVYTLIAMGKSRDRRALTASLKYLILGSIGATFILLGIGYLLMLTGTLNMADMHEQLVALVNDPTKSGTYERTLLVAFAFLAVGLSMKMALFPLHMWLPDAYTYAPSAVSAMVASTATKVGVYMAFRFIFTIFGGVYTSELSLILLGFCACLGIIFSSLSAITARNVKRVLAYSSVGQLGYIVLGFSLASLAGVTSSVLHIFNHAVIKGAMFMAVGCVVLRIGSARVDMLKGLGKTMPWTMGAFTIGGCGLIGFPLTSGFISKWYLLQAAWSFESELLPWMGNFYVGVVIVGGLLALIYVWRLLEMIWFTEPDPERTMPKEAPLIMLIPTWALALCVIYFGLDADLTASIAAEAAKILTGGAS
jgi:multicomponent Na+:H+ antiporter subunit D